MMVDDVIFLMLVIGLPIIVSIRLFHNEPRGRPFFGTYVLAVMGSSFLFALTAFVLALIRIGGLSPFDGFFELIVSVPVALVVGLYVRRQRRSPAK
jgi:hypothetical protein